MEEKTVNVVLNGDDMVSYNVTVDIVLLAFPSVGFPYPSFFFFNFLVAFSHPGYFFVCVKIRKELFLKRK